VDYYYYGSNKAHRHFKKLLLNLYVRNVKICWYFKSNLHICS